MPSLKEIALGIASVLRATTVPDPLPVTLMGQSVEQAAFLVRTIVSECRDAGIRLARIEVPEEVSLELGWEGNCPVEVACNTGLTSELHIFRG